MNTLGVMIGLKPQQKRPFTFSAVIIFSKSNYHNLCPKWRVSQKEIKNFTKSKWSNSLAAQRWEDLGGTETLEEMTTLLTERSNCSINMLQKQLSKWEIIIKLEIQIKQRVKRDLARSLIKTKSPAEKSVRQAVNKKLRNRVITELRKDNKSYVPVTH